MKNTKEKPTVKANQARGSQAELAQKIASFLGKEENRTTEIPGVSLHQRTAPYTAVPDHIPSGSHRARTGQQAGEP